MTDKAQFFITLEDIFLPAPYGRFVMGDETAMRIVEMEKRLDDLITTMLRMYTDGDIGYRAIESIVEGSRGRLREVSKKNDKVKLIYSGPFFISSDHYRIRETAGRGIVWPRNFEYDLTSAELQKYRDAQTSTTQVKVKIGEEPVPTIIYAIARARMIAGTDEEGISARTPEAMKRACQSIPRVDMDQILRQAKEERIAQIMLYEQEKQRLRLAQRDINPQANHPKVQGS